MSSCMLGLGLGSLENSNEIKYIISHIFTYIIYVLYMLKYHNGEGWASWCIYSVLKRTFVEFSKPHWTRVEWFLLFYFLFFGYEYNQLKPLKENDKSTSAVLLFSYWRKIRGIKIKGSFLINIYTIVFILTVPYKNW